MPFGAQFVLGPRRIPTLGLAAIKGSPLFRQAGATLKSKPYAFIAGCVDDRDGIASVFQLDGGG